MSAQRGSRLATAVLGATLLVGAVARASDLDDPLEFAQLAREGWEEAVNGAYSVPGPSPFPDLPPNPDGSVLNAYPWSMAWWQAPGDDSPALWVGTVRSLLCFLSPDLVDPADCPAPSESQPLPLPRFPEEVAEVWKYVPSASNGGIDGTWTRVFGGPTPNAQTVVAYPAKCFLQGEGEILGCLLSFGNGYPDFPQHIGLRSAAVCDANGSDEPVERLYFANLGIPAQVIYTEDGVTFQDASSAGDTFASLELADLTSGEVDLGYRGLVCWQGKLCTAPAGSFEDTDTTIHPWIICNEDPSNPSSPWEAHSEFGFGDPDDIGVFDMAVVDVEPAGDLAPEVQRPATFTPAGSAPIEGEAWLCASGFDRTNGGSVWCTDGTGCDVDVAPPAGVRDCVWTEYVKGGMGRPNIILGINAEGPSANAAAFGMGTFDNDDDPFDDFLYFGMADAAGGPNANNALAEMGRINFNRDAGAGAPEQGPAPKAPFFGAWELVVGIPRVVDFPDALQGVLPTEEFVIPPEMDCTPVLDFNLQPIIIALSGGAFNPGPVPTDLCLPISGRGLAMGPTAFEVGNSTYFWRFAQHQGDLFVGDLDTEDFDGFELWKTSNGTTFEQITDDGFGWGDSNYGVRGLLSTDPTPGEDNVEPMGPWLGAPIAQPVLWVAVANPFSSFPGGGSQVWVGDSESSLPPVAVADGIPNLFDDECCPSINDCSLPCDGMVTATLDGNDSFDAFGGVIGAWDWFETDVSASCASPGTANASGAGPMGYDVTCGAGAGTPYTFTLRVVDDDLEFACDTESFVASCNLRPFVEVITVPPPTGSTVRLVDFDGDGKESFQIASSRCLDPEGSLTACFWDTLDGGATFSPARLVDDPIGSPITGTYAFTVTALIEEDSASMFGDDSPDIELQGEDGFFSSSSSFDIRVESFVDTADANDAPDCASGVLVTLENVTLTMSPIDTFPTNPPRSPRCGDADVGETATLEFEVDPGDNFGPLSGTAESFPDAGGTDTMLQYVPPASETGFDEFRFEARDVNGADSNEVDVGVRVIACPSAAGDLGAIDVVVDAVTYASPATETGCLTVTSINATTVQAPNSVTFEAGEAVILDNGFVVQNGAGFTVEIDPTLFSE